jgi:hypothetical protein
LREKGWIEGKNLLIEYRDAKTPDRFSALAVSLHACGVVTATPLPVGEAQFWPRSTIEAARKRPIKSSNATVNGGPALRQIM